MLSPKESFEPSRPLLFDGFVECRTRAQSRDLALLRVKRALRPLVRCARFLKLWR